jgi:AcrR family transcriptional regulator
MRSMSKPPAAPRKPAAKRAAKKPAARGRRPLDRGLRAAKDALYREHIIDVAERVFGEQGFAKTKMQDIARAAGISLGTLYQSYPGKRELYRGLLIARDTQMLNAVVTEGQGIIQQPRSIEQVLGLMEVHLRFLLNHPDYLRMQLQEGHAWYHGAAHPSSVEQQLWERGLSVMEQLFRWGIDEELFVPDQPANLARMLLSMQQTRLANWMMADMQESHEAVIRRVQADFVRVFCRTAVAAKLLNKDSANLSAATLKRMHAPAAK